FDILPVAVLDGPGQTEFTINYRNFLVGVAAASPFGAKIGHRISVKADSLDGLIEGYGLRLPDLIKMDVEGAEVVAVLGMRRTLARCHPTIVFELHGQLAARKTLDALEWAHYRYEDPKSGREFANARELADWFPDACLQIVGRPA